jgi:protein-S-isoprenylcysteine O-methyltransferase Ste14
VYIIKQKRKAKSNSGANHDTHLKHSNSTVRFGKIGIMIINIFITLASFNIFFYDLFRLILPHIRFFGFNAVFQIIGLIFAIVGNILLNISYRTLGIYWEYPIDGKKKKRKLVKTGVYSKIRHPIYLSFYLICIGLFFMILDVLLLILLLLGGIGLYLQALEEEKTLYEAFGKEFLRYKNQTGRFFAVLRKKTDSTTKEHHSLS